MKADGLKNKKLGIPKSVLNSPYEQLNSLLRKAMEDIKQQGAEVIELEEKMDNKIYDAEYQVLLYEFKDGLNKYLSNSNAKVKSLKEVIDYDNKNEDQAMPYFKQEILEQAEAKGDLESKEYKDALMNSQTKARKYIDEILSKYKLDAICGAAYGPAWCTDFVNGDHFTSTGMNIPAAIAGYPSISVPMGFIHELPVGFTFVGKAFAEPELISLAFAYEQISKGRKPPKFIQSLED